MTIVKKKKLDNTKSKRNVKMTTNPLEKNRLLLQMRKPGLKIKEEGFAQGLLCPLSSDQNHEFGWSLIFGSGHLFPVHTLNFTIKVGWTIKPDLHFPISHQIL